MELVGIVFLLVLAGILRYITHSPKRIGGAAEKRVQRILSGLPQNEYVTINDVLIRRPNGNTAQIDHVVVSLYGVFVLETKNYHGHMVGQENEKYWTQRIGNQRHRLYNPIWQNRGHIHALQELLGRDVPMCNVVLFGDRVGLSIQAEQAVIRIRQLKQFMAQFHMPKLTMLETAEIVERIRRANITDKTERARHVQQVQGKKQV